jgi:lactate dehydrogenase-like 2-hydroxyacid dehydrogenase
MKARSPARSSRKPANATGAKAQSGVRRSSVVSRHAVRPVVVVEDDPFLRLVQVVLDPRTPAARVAAFSHFFAHELPDFEGWRDGLRARLSRLHPAEVRLVADESGLPSALAGAAALVLESFSVGGRELAAARGGLRAIQKYGIVLSNIDVAACEDAGVSLLTVRRRVNVSCAEHAMALMLALARKIHATAGLVSVEQLRAAGYEPTQYDRAHTANANWARITGARNLWGSQLGIVGLGEIGRELASRARAFGMRIVYTQRRRVPPHDEERYGAGYVALDELLAGSDFISLNLPLTDATRGILGRRELALVKPGAMLVNVSRPSLVDCAALLEALRSGRLGGFGLDPHYDAPGHADDPLLALRNVIITPHLAAAPRFNALGDIEELLLGLDRSLAGEPQIHADARR